MKELTELEEQRMIEKAREGDPEANYKMFFWALEQEAAEPEEERWNRLAAKCLVTAAEAGYAPAKEQMEKILARLEKKEKASATAFVPEEEFESLTEEKEPKPTPSRKRGEEIGKAAAERGKTALSKIKGLFSGLTAGSGNHGTGGWSKSKWKKMQLICSVACVVLAFVIVLMIVSGRSAGGENQDIQMPEAATAEPLAVTPSPTPEPYPDEETIAAIDGAELDIYPGTGDYVSGAMTAIIDAYSGLNLRTGPATSYDQIVYMDPDARVDIYAMNNGWALIRYEEDTYGWCSMEYLDVE